VEWRKEDSRDWVQEKISFECAYGSERMVAYLFLPKNGTPPFQTVVYFPGSGSVLTESSDNLEKYGEFEAYLSHFLKNKRAVLYPVYKGTFERRSPELEAIHSGADSHQFTEYLIQLVKDLKRSVDYLETRPDIDSRKLAYLGFSWGGLCANIIPAVEDRIKVCMTLAGGIWARGRPEANELSYVRHVRMPFLMLNGRYDMTFIYDLNVKPMFDLLGTPDQDKKLVLFDTDHYVPPNGVIKETLAWLDKYFGPAR
jgi:dienelactone hydrolase